MAHAQAENWPPVGTFAHGHIWKLTRTMLAAGWTHLASSDGYQFSISAGTDKWAGMVQNYTTLNVSFTNPGNGNTVSATVGSTAWMSNGQVLYIQASNGGMYTVFSVTDLTHVVLTQQGSQSGSVVAVANIFTIGDGAWWLGQGPSTLKIPFTAAVTGTFIRGENISQATSSATGEVIGVVWDGASAGYLVVMPRTGTFDNTHVITGGFSGAAVTPNGTIVTYVRQVVFWMSISTSGGIGTYKGHLYYQCVDPVGESSDSFNSAARLAAVTASVCPGGAASGANAFPSNGTYAVIGTGGSGASGTGPFLWGCHGNSVPTYSNAQILCANATPSSGVSADGSFICAISSNSVNAGAHCGFAFQRCDNGEDGDVDPYAWFAPSGVAYGSGVRTASATYLTAGVVELMYMSVGSSGVSWNKLGNNCGWKSWRRRGLSSDGYVDLAAAVLAIDTGASNSSPTFGLVLNQATADADKVASAAVSTYVREPLWLANYTSTKKVRKGTPRWMFVVNSNNGTDTYDSKKWIQFANSGVGIFPLVGGPADGSTTPTSA